MFLAFYLLWTVLPIFVMFVSSFKDLLEAFKLPAVGDWAGVTLFFDFNPTFKHYHNLFANLNFTTYLLQQHRSLARLRADLGGPGLDVRLRPVADRFPGKKDLFFWIISTRMAPVVAVMVPLYAIFRSAGLVGTLPGLILAYTTFNLPFAIWILKGFFDNVPYAIEEAAMCDGATRLQAFRAILPLVAPGIGAFLVLCVLFAWNDFLFASIIGSGGAKTLPVATQRAGPAAEHPVGQHHGGGCGDHAADDVFGPVDPALSRDRADHGRGEGIEPWQPSTSPAYGSTTARPQP